MKRCLRMLWTAAVLLLLGAVVNVLVAWGCVITARPIAAPSTRAPMLSTTTDPLAQQAGWRLTGVVQVSSGRGLTETSVSYVRPNQPDSEWIYNRMDGMIWRAGWPFRTLGCAWFDEFTLVGGLSVSWLSPWPNGLPRLLPITPQWPGFAANTALYAAVLGCALVCLKWARSRYRRVLGSCESCGYDLSGSVGGVCPECGAKA